MNIDDLVNRLEEIRDRERSWESPYADAENALVEWFVENGHEEVQRAWDEVKKKHPWYHA